MNGRWLRGSTGSTRRSVRRRVRRTVAIHHHGGGAAMRTITWCVSATMACTFGVGCATEAYEEDDDGALLAAIDPDAEYQIIGIGSAKCVGLEAGATGS